MKKDFVDNIISQYIKKIYGYSLSKTYSIDDAEELSAQIIFDVYTSLLRKEDDQSFNIDAYIYRTFQNVYARFVKGITKQQKIKIYNRIKPTSQQNDEGYNLLLRQIKFLGQIHREIIVMHYFDRLGLNQIAKRLSLPLGTIKWHLHNAKKEIKEGMKMQSSEKNGIKPIKLQVGYYGGLGLNGKAPHKYLSKLISQNIVYSTYHSAKTIVELAKELDIAAAFIEDEVEYLLDIEFLEKVSGGKYLTNVFIFDPSKETLEKEYEIFDRCAKTICDKYVPLVVDYIEKGVSDMIYTPQNDINFLKWCLIVFACGKKVGTTNRYETALSQELKRKDGSEYVALAWTKREHNLSYNPDEYYFSGDHTCDFTDNPDIISWQNDSIYNLFSHQLEDSEILKNKTNLYKYFCGQLKKDPENIDIFKNLYDNKYLINENGIDYVNMLVARHPHEDFIELLPKCPGELMKISIEADQEMYELHKTHHPSHNQKLCQEMCQNVFSDNNTRGHIVKQLLDNGVLKPLTENQKYTVNTILFCDTLPD